MSGFKKNIGRWVKNGVVIFGLLICLYFINGYALKHASNPFDSSYYKALENEKFDMIFMGNSTMYKNLGGTNTLINKALSEKMGRPINVKFVAHGGTRADWMYLMLKEYVSQIHSHKPVVWFFWTGMPFDPALNTLENTEKMVNKFLLEKTKIKNIQEEIVKNRESDIFSLSEFLEQHFYLYRISGDFSENTRKILSDFFRNYFGAKKNLLLNLYEGINPFQTGNKNSMEKSIVSKKYTPQEYLEQFDEFTKNSFFPKINEVAKQYGINLVLLEVSTKFANQDNFTEHPQFLSGKNFKTSFLAFREKQNKYLKTNGYTVISFVNDPCIESQKDFMNGVYLNDALHEHFTECVAEKIKEANILQ